MSYQCGNRFGLYQSHRLSFLYCTNAVIWRESCGYDCQCRYHYVMGVGRSFCACTLLFRIYVDYFFRQGGSDEKI